MKNPYSSTLNVHVSSRSVLSFSSVHRSNTAPVKSGSGTGICQIKSYFFVIAHDTVHHHTHAVHTSPFGLVAFSLRFFVCVCACATLREMLKHLYHTVCFLFSCYADWMRPKNTRSMSESQSTMSTDDGKTTAQHSVAVSRAGFHSTENRREQAHKNYYDSDVRYVCNVFRVFCFHLYSNIDKHSNLRLHATVWCCLCMS